MNKMTAKNIPTLIANIGKVILLVMAAMLLMAPAPSNGQSSKYVATTNTLKPQILPQNTPPAAVVQEVKKSYPTTTKASYAAPGGSSGYVMAGNNCVACVKAKTGRGQNGNAGTWTPSHSTPQIGDIMIWRPGQMGAGSAGHVGVVTGVNPDGTVNIAHCNWPGQTRFASTGLFW